MFSFNKLSRTRSTNPVEAWHSVIKRDSANIRHGSLQNTLSYFQTLFAEADERVVKILRGKIKPRSRDAKYSEIDNKIQNAIMEYEEMIDQNQISEDEFGSTTSTYLNRLSYLLLQLDDRGISTRKDMKIRERKKKLKDLDSNMVVDRQPEVFIENHPGIVIEKPRELVIERPRELVIERPRELVIERPRELVIEGQPKLMITKDPEILDESESEKLANSRGTDESHVRDVSSSQEVEHIATLARHSLRLLFNPPNDLFQQNICETWEYQCGQPLVQYTRPFEFTTDNYGPGDVLEILADGNCGWRAVALGLTSNQENHEMIRRDVIEYLEESIYQHRLFDRHDNDWWSLFYDLPTIRRHIELAVTPAVDSGDVERWMDNIDFAATAKMFRINIVVCERVRQNIYRWQLYSHELHSSLITLNQVPGTATIFLHYRGNHYELIKEPRPISS